MSRPKKPTAIKKAHGTLRKCRETPQEPDPAKRLPDPPQVLDEVGRAEWERAGKILEAQGLMTDMDLVALAAYCAAVADFFECERILRRDGLTCLVTMTAGGGQREVERPQVRIKYQALKTIRAFMTEFGMSPASRSRVNAEPPESEAARTARASGDPEERSEPGPAGAPFDL